MKPIKFAGFLLAVMLSGQVMAEKVVVLDAMQALRATEAAKQFDAGLKEELADKQAQLLDLEKQAKAAKDKLDANRGLASPEQLKQLQEQFKKAFAEYQRRGKEMQQEGMQRQQAFMNEMRPKVDKVVNDLIQQEGYDIILSRSAISYAKPELDITAKVVELLNKQ